MTRQLPGWLSALLVLIGALGVFYIVGTSGPVKQAAEPGTDVASKEVPAPDFTAQTLDGKTFRLSEQKGKVILLNFWATWCGPCREEMPDLMALQKKYAGRGFTIIGMAHDKIESVEPFVKTVGLNYPVLIAPDETVGEYEATGLPTSVLIDKTGKVVYYMQGVPAGGVEALWSEKIDKIL